MDLHVGDLLQISCPATPARVVEKSSTYLVVEWPWWTVDPLGQGASWNGCVAITIDPSSYDWERELFSTEPAPAQLNPGDICRIGIPPTIVRVLSVDTFDPPLETGYLPRPRRLVTVLPANQPVDVESEDQGYSLDPDDGIPITFEPVPPRD